MVDDEWVRSSLNQKGVMVKQFSNVSQAFIRDAASATHDLIDMGCAYGIATLAVLEMKKHIIACDLEQEHLAILKQETPEDLLPYLELRQGYFPYDFDFEKSTISGVHCSYVLHFLTGEEVTLALKSVYDWLVPEGCFYLSAATPYQKSLTFIDEFNRCEVQGEDFPGQINLKTMSQFIRQERLHCIPENVLPDFTHVFTIEILTKALKRAGFTIENAHYFDINFPEQLDHFFGGNGRGFLGIIARKPC
ncbi:class I SAM-dependent methyltransferase [uncultured Shewanella sp.]|uniref:class I SAM-dependent methyltransferase n=1 Tax=uncultured Shewanella sp. TaxID=173975 RepID=UPI0026299148|nr:class I SAM-dependent methyltransferase [uncultured Shewanella sp.]